MDRECSSPTKHKLPILFDPTSDLIDNLDEAELFELQQKTKKVNKSFRRTFYQTWKYLSRINIKELIQFLKLMLSSTHDISALKKVKDYDNLFDFLSESISWFNYEIMEELVKEFLQSNASVISSWESYKADLKEYSNGRVEEYTGVKFGLAQSKKVLLLKIDPEFNTMKLSKIKELQSAICNILGKPYTLLYFVGVDHGSMHYPQVPHLIPQL